jgi:hypothetical protein
MSSTIMHILNGDATLHGFEQTGIDGDVMVWREVLSEGPLSKNIASAAFWEARSEWITKMFSETPDGYHAKVIAPLEKLNQPYQEINLWFEFDLHCQVNLMGVMQLLAQHTDLSDPAIYLICPAEYPGIENFKGMGELSEEQLEYLFDNTRVQLSDYDFVLATEAWKAYISHDAGKLQQWLNSTTWANMALLRPAMEAQLKRLQINANGLNYIQQKLLDIYNSGIHTRAAIYHDFWDTERIYGMGDKEIDSYLDKLAEKGLIKL